MILKLKRDLEKEGFKTCWYDPFFAWMHPEDAKMKELQSEPGNTFYICDLPIPKVVPFDLAVVSISVREQIHFQLSLYYITILEDEVERDAINAIFDRHATEWSVIRTDYFSDIASRFSLLWDTEYDDFIEDSLWGNFPFDSVEAIIPLMKAIKG
ncbi:MAG: hypothetical protein JRC90_01855 [Deltaproteobacteria bacterium]|nr:hypothetical protein [Deltaproteobacteria bacterium]